MSSTAPPVFPGASTREEGDDAGATPVVITESDYRTFFRQAGYLLPELAVVVEAGIQSVPDIWSLGITGLLQIQRDLMFVAYNVSSVDGKFHDKEVLVLADLLSIYGDDGELAFYRRYWPMQVAELRAQVMKVYLSVTSGALRNVPGWQWSYDGQCITMLMLRYHDERTGSQYGEAFADLAMTFASIVAKADSVITKSEKESMHQLREWLWRLN